MADSVFLRAHSDYTLRDGCMTVEEYLNRLDALGYGAAALTDTHNLFGAFKFFQGARKRGIRPILGVDLRVREADGSWRKGFSRLRVLVENRTGYRHLCRLVGRSYRDRRPGSHPVVTMGDLEEAAGGLIVVGPPATDPDRSDGPTVRDRVRDGLERFGDRFVVEVPVRGPHPGSLLRHRVEAAREAGVPAVLTHPAYFPTREDFPRLPLRIAVQTNTSLEALEELPDHRRHQWVIGPDRWEDWLGSGASELMRQTAEVASRCRFSFETDTLHLPRAPGDGPAGARLETRCRRALKARDLAASETEARDRLEHELSVICEMGFADYFLIVGELVHWARQEGIRVGPGRGSAAGSLVAYLLGITRVDPFEFDLIFERFLNPARQELPDIDIDFADHRRDEVIQHLRDRFGAEAVAHIITFGRIKARNALRDVGRVRGEDSSRIDALAESVPAGSEVSLSDRENRPRALRELVEEDPGLEDWLQAAARLQGFVRNASVHAAGMLVLDRPIEEVLPLYYPDERDPVSACQFDMYDLEALGHLKLDVLGLTTLTLLDRTLERVPEDRRPDLESLPDEDPETLAWFAEQSLEGVFQFESRSGRELARRMRPRSRREVVDCIALNRPGPAQYQEAYLRRRSGEESIEYPHEDLEPVLEDTYGLVIYQEQVMAIARRIGGFSWAEADRMRKAMGKKDSVLMETLQRRFLRGARENGYDEGWARDLFDQLARFAEYGFNRSHSAAYGEITYRTAYLKAHFTPAFYAALLSLKSDDRDRVARVAEAMREDGLVLIPPSVQRSDPAFTVEEDGVRYGLTAVKHVGEDLAEAIRDARREKPFEDLVDFVSRVSPERLGPRAFQALAAGGCFDGFDVERGPLVDAAEDWLALGARRHRERKSGQGSLFGGDDGRDSAARPSGGEPWSEARRRRAEREALGLVIAGFDLEG